MSNTELNPFEQHNIHPKYPQQEANQSVEEHNKIMTGLRGGRRRYKGPYQMPGGLGDTNFPGDRRRGSPGCCVVL